MSKAIVPYDVSALRSVIRIIRSQRVMLDTDLAKVYGVTVKRLNEQVRRNPDRFPEDFAFVLTAQEDASLRSQNATLKRGAHRKHPVIAFTEHGAIMAANVLRSPQAVRMSVFVVRAFVKMREQLIARSEMEKRLLQIENILLSHDDAIRDLYDKLRPLLLPPPDPDVKPIGFHVRERRGRYAGRRPGT